ncbi:hypothetical protein CCP4SC76_5150009 [Gammaproteobacteria bacterium]
MNSHSAKALQHFEEVEVLETAIPGDSVSSDEEQESSPEASRSAGAVVVSISPKVNPLLERHRVLDEQLEQLGTQVFGLDETTAVLGGRLAQLEARGRITEAGIQQLEVHADQIDRLNDSQQKTGADLVMHQERLGRLERYVIESQSRFSENDKGIATLVASTDAVVSQLRALEQREGVQDQQIASLSGLAQQTVSAVEALRGHGVDLESRVSLLDDRSQALMAQTDSLESSHGQAAQEIGLLQQVVAQQAAKDQAIEQRVARSAWILGGALALASMAGIVGYLSNQGGIHQVASQLTTGLADQQQALSDLGSEVTQLNEMSKTYQDRLEDLSRMMLQLQAEEKQNSQDHAAMTHQVDDLVQEIGVLKESIKAKGGAVTSSEVEFRGGDWIHAQAAKHYTIQVMGSYSAVSLEAVARQFSWSHPLAIVKKAREGRDWYVLLYGSFVSLSEAQRLTTALPKAVQPAKPFVRTFHGIQETISSAR